MKALLGQPDLSTPPIVLRQTKQLGRLFVATGTLALLVALSLGLLDGLLRLQAMLLALVGGLALGLGLLVLWRPNQLILTPEGLSFRTMVRRYSWRWQEVSSFEKTRITAGKTRAVAIGFTSTPAAASRWQVLPAYWELPVEDVVALLNSARTKWGG